MAQDYNAETPIAQIMSASPLAVDLLIAARAACVGCPMAIYCSLAEVCRQYNLNREQLLQQFRQA